MVNLSGHSESKASQERWPVCNQLFCRQSPLKLNAVPLEYNALPPPMDFTVFEYIGSYWSN